MEESKYPFQTSCRFSAAKKNTLSNTYGFFALKYYNYNCIGCSVRLRETMEARYMTKAKIIYRKSVQIRVIRGNPLLTPDSSP